MPLEQLAEVARVCIARAAIVQNPYGPLNVGRTIILESSHDLL
jgi:hypothetical protein